MTRPTIDILGEDVEFGDIKDHREDQSERYQKLASVYRARYRAAARPGQEDLVEKLVEALVVGEVAYADIIRIGSIYESNSTIKPNPAVAVWETAHKLATTVLKELGIKEIHFDDPDSIFDLPANEGE